MIECQISTSARWHYTPPSEWWWLRHCFDSSCSHTGGSHRVSPARPSRSLTSTRSTSCLRSLLVAPFFHSYKKKCLFVSSMVTMSYTMMCNWSHNSPKTYLMRPLLCEIMTYVSHLHTINYQYKCFIQPMILVICTNELDLRTFIIGLVFHYHTNHEG